MRNHKRYLAEKYMTIGTLAPDLPERNGVQSVEVGLALFQQLVLAGKPMALSDLARMAGMHRSKAHRYLVSLSHAGFVQQDVATGHYDLGPYLMDLSVAWLTRQNPVQQAIPVAAQLAQACNETCFISVWGSGGATVLRLFQPLRPVAISIAEGTVFGLTMSATGRVFAAWLPVNQTKAGIQQEMAQSATGDADFASVLEEVRSSGIARVQGENVSGINAISAPVFDVQGRLVLALTLVGPESSLDVSDNGLFANQLRAAAIRLSGELGYTS